MHQTADDLELALHATGESPQRFEQVAVLDAQQTGELVDLLLVSARHGRKAWPEWIQTVQDRMEADVFLRREVKIQAGLLEDNPDLVPDRARFPAYIMICDAYNSRRGSKRCGEDRKSRCLSRPVRT